MLYSSNVKVESPPLLLLGIAQEVNVFLFLNDIKLSAKLVHKEMKISLLRK